MLLSENCAVISLISIFPKAINEIEQTASRHHFYSGVRTGDTIKELATIKAIPTPEKWKFRGQRDPRTLRHYAETWLKEKVEQGPFLIRLPDSALDDPETQRYLDVKSAIRPAGHSEAVTTQPDKKQYSMAYLALKYGGVIYHWLADDRSFDDF